MAMQLAPATIPSNIERSYSILICLLGQFRLVKMRHPITVPCGDKAKALLCHLALWPGCPTPRDTLLETLWPHSSRAEAGQSLNSLICSLHKLVGGELGGAAPISQLDGYYQLNLEAGVGVDVTCFDRLAAGGDQEARHGNLKAAEQSYLEAILLYHGDLCIDFDAQAVIERERLRARYLSLLAHLADYHFSTGDYEGCLDYAGQLLVHDPCREDAHRLVMRCYVRRGERALALRQYRLCRDILRAEFDATPELCTTALYDLVRLDPHKV
jgi:DNA-binding SARP family transcriptional activator